MVRCRRNWLWDQRLPAIDKQLSKKSLRMRASQKGKRKRKRKRQTKRGREVAKNENSKKRTPKQLTDLILGAYMQT